MKADEEREELYMESVRRFNERRQRENRLAWCEYHREAAERTRRTLEALIRDHEDEAEKLLEDGAA